MYRQRRYDNDKLNEAVNELTAYTLQKDYIAELKEKQAEYLERYSALQAVAYDNICVLGGHTKDSIVETAIKWADLDVLINQKIQAAELLLWKVKDKLDRLPPLTAKVLELYYIKHRSVNKIATIMSYSTEWVKTTKYDGLKKYSELPKLHT